MMGPMKLLAMVQVWIITVEVVMQTRTMTFTSSVLGSLYSTPTRPRCSALRKALNM